MTATEGAPATFTCPATGTALQYTWYRDASLIPGAEASTYTITSVEDADHEAVFQCRAVNRGNTEVPSNDATLTVLLNAPQIITDPVSISVMEDEQATFTVDASGTALVYQWYLNGDAITDGTGVDETYTILQVTNDDHGAELYCEVSNRGNPTITSGTAILTVLLDPPVIDVQPVDVTVMEGDPASFSVQVTGTDPSYQWHENGVPIDGATTATYDIPATSYALNLSEYTCRVENRGNAPVWSDPPAVLHVDLYPPEFTTHPSDLMVDFDTSFTLTCVAEGTLVTYQWQKDGQDLTGETGTSYTVQNAAPEHEGQYRCAATNPAATVYSNPATVELNVIPPAITTHPSSQSVSLDAPFTLSVVATGTDIVYQWQRFGADIPGATAATYTKSQSTSADDGAAYRVVVSNVVGSVTSNAATITVTDTGAPTLTVNNPDSATISGDTIVVSGTATDLTGVQSVTIVNDQFGDQQFGVVLDENGNFEGEVPLAVGTNVLTITTVDEDGNQTQHTITVIVEVTSLPRMTITSPESGTLTSDDTVDVQGVVRSSLAPEEIRLSLGSRVTFPEAADSDSDYEHAFTFPDVPLIPGFNTLTVVADTVHGTVTESVVVRYGEPEIPEPTGIPPVISLQVPQPEIYLTTDTIHVSGTVTAGTCIQSVDANGVAAEITGSGSSISFDAELSFIALGTDDVNVLVTAVDCNGLQATAGYTAHYDADAPVLTIDGLQLSPAVNSVVETPYRVTGTVTEPNLAGLSVNDQSLGVLPGAGDTYIFYLDIPLVRLVEHPLSFEAWDLAGNRTSQTVVLRLDTAFEVEVLSPRDGANLLVSGDTTLLEVTARAVGMAADDEVVAQFDTADPAVLNRSGDVASGLLNVPADQGAHELAVWVRDFSGTTLTSTVVRLTFTDADAIPLEVVRQQPPNGAKSVESNSHIVIHFNKPVDLSQLEMSVLETAHGKIYSDSEPGADLSSLSQVGFEEVHRELEPVPGNSSNFPGNTMIAFFPSRDLAYGGTVFVELTYAGQTLYHSSFQVRPLPTLLAGFVADSLQQPLKGIEVVFPDLDRSAVTNSDGAWQFGYGEPDSEMLLPGRHRLVVNPSLKNDRYGTVERYVTIEKGERNRAGVIVIPYLSPTEPFRRVASGQSSPALLASSDLTIDLSQAELTFPDGRDEGDVHTQFLQSHEIGYGALGTCLPSFAYAISPAGIRLQGELEVEVALPRHDGSYTYVEELPERVLLVGLDPDSLLLVPAGVMRVDKTGFRLVSEGKVELHRLDYVAISRGPTGTDQILERYVNGEISIDQLVAELEAR